jgi:hypothetical protein
MIGTSANGPGPDSVLLIPPYKTVDNVDTISCIGVVNGSFTVDSPDLHGIKISPRTPRSNQESLEMDERGNQIESCPTSVEVGKYEGHERCSLTSGVMGLFTGPHHIMLPESPTGRNSKILFGRKPSVLVRQPRCLLSQSSSHSLANCSCCDASG